MRRTLLAAALAAVAITALDTGCSRKTVYENSRQNDRVIQRDRDWDRDHGRYDRDKFDRRDDWNRYEHH